MRLFAPQARLPHGWAENVLIEVDERGLITAVTEGASPDGATRLPGPILPAVPNLHSHAFQRGMAGLGERRGAEGDDFWSWREVMYRFLDRMTPEDLEAVAARLYVEMVEAGYSRVCEFHYVHNDADGRAYADPLETARAHIRAAKTAGIALTLVPVLYSHSNFGGQPPKHGQRRFIQSTDAYLAQIEALGVEAAREDFDLGVSVHSLRAATPEQIAEVLKTVPATLPVHIHVAEQTKEVDDCLAWSGARPVEWLLDNVGLDDRWRLVHATHMTPEETRRTAESGAVAVVCPTTEGNLGDGFFDVDGWFAAGGAFGIGTDSHVSIDPREELRWFEYARRLRHRKRGLAATPSQPYPGARLWLDAATADDRGGGAPTGAIAPAKLADFVVLDADAPLIGGRSGDALIDSFVFVSNAGPSPIRETWIKGRRVTDAGRHPQSEQTARAYAETVRRLAAD
ncbi:formimidoylglutamate deiminase [Caulobacter sp. 17J80-11]|uniref:formimidoylglutamate deiminase n=1 Tax=Caulobacter sp. 17J80-11 TaxID=2763502 RepID=UPI001653BC9E|nr:formimidoylglutamate deiminase [Caulobacter sp. 17J80-11]MBC6983448.1 formimidoylglutamate deiminase [Caulobacter sp. 17J80-11]